MTKEKCKGDSLDNQIISEGGKFFRIVDGGKEEVWYDVIFGWCSLKELSDLRQTDPRMAP